MKTQIIQLDPHDDVISIREKISWAKTARILLVMPRRNRLRLRNLDLRLLRRHASLRGAQLALVTRSKYLRRLAQEEGLASFRAVSAAQKKNWPEPERTKVPGRESAPPDLWGMRREVYTDHTGWQDLPAVRIAVFTLAALMVLILVVLFLPTAIVQLQPATRLQTLAIPVSADASVTAVNLTGSVPAQSLSMYVERSQTAKVTGTTTLPDRYASGTVRFRNLTSKVVTIPAGTIVRTLSDPPVRFTTRLDATLPADPAKTLAVSVRAVAGGAGGNVEAETVVAIEGDLGVSVSVANPDAMTGGTDQQVLAPTAVERARLRTSLEQAILDECKTSFQEKAGAGGVLFPDTLAIAEVVSEAFLPPEGQEGDTLSLTLNAQCQVRFASAEDLSSLAQMGMDVNLPAGFEPVSEGPVTSAVDLPKTDADGITHWKMQAQRLLHAHVEPLAAVELSQGRTKGGAARRLLAALPLEAAPDIRLKPSWWPWLPVFPFRISVSLGDS